ncbi:nodulation efficiency protein D-like protein [Gottschalkia purinilytica]|uniref:Nodulation efficiency protein D-like protein n=1 Tax=Gottschalkia purinilytica TaxID=1503 RepID=A0A0L0WA13_GOTPU|nr:NfeD family protein [Gottschalkia purinilytica]KNF08140.1 nodulation efficiency protein D-like protein [Gottschalkia purinilytica]
MEFATLGFTLTAELFWIIVAVICGVVEIATLGITSIWFVVGALIAWLLAELNLPFEIQILAFFISSGVMLYFTRPIAQRLLKIGHAKTNTDLLIGEIGIVIKDIETINSVGQVKVKGQVWSAKTSGEEDIAKDEKIEVVGIEGVKLIVKKIK